MGLIIEYDNYQAGRIIRNGANGLKMLQELTGSSLSSSKTLEFNSFDAVLEEGSTFAAPRKVNHRIINWHLNDGFYGFPRIIL